MSAKDTKEERNMSLKPLFDRVVIRNIETEEVTKGGILLTSAAKEKPQMAEVVAVGPGSKGVDMVVKVGDKVVYTKYAGTEVKIDGQEVIVIKQSDILAIVE
jgi:chaperonin GroES